MLKEMVLSSVGVGGLLESNLLLPFHSLNSNSNSNSNSNRRRSSNNLHFLPIGLQPSLQITRRNKKKKKNRGNTDNGFFYISCCSTESIDNLTTTTTTSDTSMEETPLVSEMAATATATSSPPSSKPRMRYRKKYPGEDEGIVGEMRFVAMRLHSKHGKKEEESNSEGESEENDGGNDYGDQETWEPSQEGFLKYLVDSKLVFETLERVVDKSDNDAYTHFRKTGLERSKAIARDLEWFKQQNITIPQPSSPGVSYAEYLKNLAEKSAPLFLCHFYNIYFAHVSGGQVIAKQVSEKILEGKELEFCTWKGDPKELMKNVRDNINELGEDWSRDVRNKGLREAAKSFQCLSQILRLIIL